MRIHPTLSGVLILGLGLLLYNPAVVNGAGAVLNRQYQEIKKMRTIPSVFGEVFEKVSPWGGVPDANPCMPEEIRDWLSDARGLFISAPTKVITNGKYVLPICGGYRFSKKFLNQFRNINKELMIVVVNAKTNNSFSTNLIDNSLDATYPDDSISLGTDEELEKLTAGGSFAKNLYHFIPSLPKKSAKYLIYALLGDQKSNVVKVEVVDHE